MGAINSCLSDVDYQIKEYPGKKGLEALLYAETVLASRYEKVYASPSLWKGATIEFPDKDTLDKRFVVDDNGIIKIALIVTGGYRDQVSFFTAGSFISKFYVLDQQGNIVGDFPVRHLGRPAEYARSLNNESVANFFRHFAGDKIQVVDVTHVETYKRVNGECELITRTLYKYEFL